MANGGKRDERDHEDGKLDAFADMVRQDGGGDTTTVNDIKAK